MNFCYLQLDIISQAKQALNLDKKVQLIKNLQTAGSTIFIADLCQGKANKTRATSFWTFLASFIYLTS